MTIVIGSGDATGSTAAELIAIDIATTVVIDANAINSIEGSYSEIVALYNSTGIVGLENEATRREVNKSVQEQFRFI